MAPVLNQIRVISAIYACSIAQSMFFVTTAMFTIMRSDGICITQARILGDAFGLILSAISMKYLGRKPTHLIFSVPRILYWILILFPGNDLALKSGAFFGGFSAGGTINLGAILISEYTSPGCRGIFLYLNNCVYVISAMFTVIIIFNGNHIYISIIGLINVLLSLIIMYNNPESPVWLLWNGQHEKSEEIFKMLRGKSENSLKEFQEMKQAYTTYKELQDAESELKFSKRILIFFGKLLKKEFWKPSGLMVLAMVLVDMSGKHFFSMCSREIMGSFSRNRTVTDINYYLLTTLIMVGTSFLSTILVSIMKQRTLLFSSGFTAWAVLTLLSFFSIIASTGRPNVTITFFGLYFILSQLACAPLPIVLMGELFPFSYKSFGSIVTGSSNILIKFCVEQATPFLMESIKVHYTLFIYSLIMGICLFVLFYELPETKGLTLGEIAKTFEEKTGHITCDQPIIGAVTKMDCRYCSGHLV